jgi:hypothetical protein
METAVAELMPPPVARKAVESPDEFLSRRRGCALTGLTPAQFQELVDNGFIEYRVGFGRIPERYSKRSILAVRQQLIRPATRSAADLGR